MSSITTDSMYGNVTEEQDFFQLAQKRRQEAMKGMTRSPDLSTKVATDAQKAIDTSKAEEIVIPAVSDEYPENALEVMFNMQESLQNMLGKKRGTLTPDSNENLFVKSGMSIYHLGSVVTELFELDEQMAKDNYEITDLSKFELTDAYHFLMNTLLYINMKPKETLEWYYDRAKEDFHVGTIGETSVKYLIGDYIIAFGCIMQQLPYKAWKTYETFDPKVSKTVLMDMVDTVMVKFIKLYVALGMQPADIWKFYYEKNKENFDRQLSKQGRYYK